MKFLLQAEAEAELEDAVNFYDANSPAARTRFITSVNAAFDAIIATPQRWPKFSGEYRRYFLEPFPYWIIYQITPTGIVVIAIAHTSRRPGYWRLRLEH